PEPAPELVASLEPFPANPVLARDPVKVGLPDLRQIHHADQLQRFGRAGLKLKQPSERVVGAADLHEVGAAATDDVERHTTSAPRHKREAPERSGSRACGLRPLRSLPPSGGCPVAGVPRPASPRRHRGLSRYVVLFALTRRYIP